MEVAGLAFGVVSLVGVFKDCVDMLSYIAIARSLGRDFEVSKTKLEVEKTLFLQWADRVGLLKAVYDRRLGNRSTYEAVSGILASIQLLLSESKSLQERYGLRPVDGNEATEITDTFSGPRMMRFIQDFEALKIRINKKQGQTSHARKARWVIRDKTKFEGLIQELSYFNSKLNEIIPDLRGSISRMTAEDVDALQSLKSLKLVLEASAERQVIVADHARMEIERILSQRVLQRIWFRTMDDRKDDLKPAHLHTFRWALEPPQRGVKWDDLKKWFRTGSGIYWLSGKAGSGKSTLMKHLYDNQKTEMLLKEWSGDSKLILASFFFWALGTSEQKSQNGLMRALLFRVLDDDPSLIPRVLPQMWREAQRAEGTDLSLPSIAEMRQAFRNLRSSQKEARSFCFFIDGLDEFSGRYPDAIEFVNSLAGNANVKLLVSSRPIPECVGAFSKHPKLRLQDLTKGDIATYVHDTVGSYPHMITLLEKEDKDASSIITELIEKASGVFLWVVLACQSVLQGLAAYDYVEDLQIRVRELPPELEDLFRHMLKKVDPRYQGQAAKFLRLCYQSHVVTGTEPIQALGLALVDELRMDMTRLLDLHNISPKDHPSRREVLEGRLRSRCCGLLEVKLMSSFIAFNQYVNIQNETEDGQYVGEDQGLSLDATVDFIHRSVFDFLQSPGIWEVGCLQIQDDLFEPNVVLACLSLHMAHVSRCEEPDQAGSYIKDILLYGIHCDSAPSSTMMAKILLKLEDLLQGFMPPSGFSAVEKYPLWNNDSSRPNIVLLLAVEAGMVNFVDSYVELKGLASLFDVQSLPLLYHALRQPFLGSLITLKLKPSPVMLNYLLEKGFDPNKAFKSPNGIGGTPFLIWVRRLMETPDAYLGLVDAESALSAAEITEILLKGRNEGDYSYVRYDAAGRMFWDWIERKLVHISLPGPIADQLKEKGNRLAKWRPRDVGFDNSNRISDSGGPKRSRSIYETEVNNIVKRARGSEIDVEGDGIGSELD